MKLSTELNEAFNLQIIHEYKNMLIYKQFESLFENYQLINIAHYFSEQSQQEKEHGDKFVEYVNSRTGGKVSIETVDVPPIPDFSIEQMGELGELYVSTEEGTTESIESIYELVIDSKSFIDLGILEEMLNEQVEEEDTANQFALNIKMAKDLVLFDKTFGK